MQGPLFPTCLRFKQFTNIIERNRAYRPLKVYKWVANTAIYQCHM